MLPGPSNTLEMQTVNTAEEKDEMGITKVGFQIASG